MMLKTTESTMKNAALLLVLIASIGFELVEPSKLSLPRVLLPLFSKSAANYTLEISDNGCYEWTLSRLDVVQVIPLDVKPSGCSSRALISTISRELTRNTVIVIAEDVSSRETLRCDIIVDMIDSLHIVTKTRELYMEEAPEVFEVRAYDSQGNEFSTLDSVELQWNIGTGGRVDQTVLRFMTFKDSPYETPATVQTLDERGQRGHMILLEGLKTGSAKVSVSLPQSEYRQVSPAEVNLMVVANLLIDPPDAYVLKGDTVKFRLLQLRHGRIVELSIPSSQYVFTIENHTIAEAVDSRGNMLALHSGRSKILLQYSHDMSIKLPHAYITVTEPEYLALGVLPTRNWAVEVAKTYRIVVDVYDASHRKFHLGDNARIQVQIPAEYFSVKSSTVNGTVHSGYPRKIGVASVEASLKSIGSYVFENPLYTREEMSIFAPVKVTPSQYVLPWEDNLKYQVVLKATGGDGSYTWSSSNPTIATVSQTGLVKTLGLGEVNISAAMTKSMENQDTSRVMITRPSRLQIVDRFSLEAEVNRPIQLRVALYTEDAASGKEIAFTNCQQLGFKVILDEPNFRYDEELSAKENVGQACANLAVLGARIGSSRVTVQYHTGDTVLEDSAVVGTFNPLTIVQPVRGQTVLAVGTSRHLVFTGGPSNKHQKKGTRKVDYDKHIVDIYHVPSDPDVYIYNVLCMRVGDTSVKVVIGNCATADCKRSESVSIVKVICALPKLVSFHFDSRSKDCPLSSDLDRITALNYRDVNVTVVVKDSKGRQFDNATSLYAEWEVSNASLASVQFPGLLWLNASTEGSYLVPLNHFQIIKPKKKSGTVELTVRVLHYRHVLLKKLNIETEMTEFADEIVSTALVHFVEDTAVTKSSILLFNHPKNKGTIEIIPGSGYYKITQSTDAVAQFQWDKSDKHVLHVMPMSAGHVQLTIQDLCLQSHMTYVNIEVRQVSAIRVELVNKIQKGKHVLASVKLYDSEDTVLPINQVEFDLNALLSQEDILLVRQHAVNISRSEILFQVTGLKVGVSNLVFSTSFANANVHSQPISVTVYPPLTISPKHIVVPVNSRFHINAQGGPYPDCSYEFTSDNENIKVLSNGLIEGVKLGSTRITGMAVGYVTGNKNKIVFSKDTAEVSVVQLEGVHINAPLVKFMRGNTIPLYVTGSPNDLSPMVLSSLSPRLSFKWSTSSDIVSISDVLSPLDLNVRDEDRVSVRLTALARGEAVIYLKVFSSSGPVYTSSIRVEVFDDLRLTSPANFRLDSLLLSPDAKYRLKTNRNQTVITSQHLNQAGSSRDKVITVSSTGLIQSHGVSGDTYVSICASGAQEPTGLCAPVLVQVRPVVYIMLQVRSRLMGESEGGSAVDTPITTLPQGMELELYTTYHDEFGRQFTSTRADVLAETSRTDLIGLAKKTGSELEGLLVNLKSAGESVLSVWDASLSTKPRDYVKLSVGHLITPQKTHLVTGDVVCFTAPPICGPGHWHSSAPSILAVDPSLGIARAGNKPGSVSITYELPGCGIRASSVLEVLPINAIHFVPTKNKTITNAPDQVYSAELVLFNNHEATTSKSNNLVRSEGSRCQNADYSLAIFPFTCSAHFVGTAASLTNMPPLDDIFLVKPAFNIRTGLYSCEFIPTGTTISSQLHKAEVVLKAKSIHSAVSSAPLSFTFYPAPSVQTKEILFTKYRPASLQVKAYPDVLKQITVTASHEGYMDIRQVRSDTPTAQSFQIHPLEKTRTEPRSDVFVLVNSPLTQQVIRIPVRLSAEALPGQDEACMLSYLPKLTSGTQDSFFSGFQLQIWIGAATVVLVVIITILVVEYFRTPATGGAPTRPDSADQSFDVRGRSKLFHDSRLSASSPVYGEATTRERGRRPFDELSPVYGSPRKRIVLPPVETSRRSNTSVYNSSSLDNSW